MLEKMLLGLRAVIGFEPNSMDEFVMDHLDVAGELTDDLDEAVAAIVFVYKDGKVSWYSDE